MLFYYIFHIYTNKITVLLGKREKLNPLPIPDYIRI